MLKSIILIAILMNIDPIDGMQDVKKLRITRSVSCPNLTNITDMENIITITDMENIITTKPTTHIFYKNKLYNKKNKIMYLREREKNNFNMY